MSPCRVTAGKALTPPALWSRSLAMPKSSTRTKSLRPARSDSMTLSGLMSRWTMPCSCASVIDEAICSPMSSARSGGRAPLAASSARRLRPWMSSIAMKSRPLSVWPKSYSVTVCGCDSLAAVSASAWKRRTFSGELNSAESSTFSATSRLRPSCSAL